MTGVENFFRGRVEEALFYQEPKGGSQRARSIAGGSGELRGGRDESGDFRAREVVLVKARPNTRETKEAYICYSEPENDVLRFDNTSIWENI